MADYPACPSCSAEYTYEDRGLYVCPSCGHEWSSETIAEEVEEGLVVRDANGNPLADGDNVTLIKDLKVKGSSSVIKVGTKVRINRLVEGDHDIDCKVDGIGPMMLKSEFVKKA
ncbi:zinc ribbon domain-containing protein YjdM [Aestuariirhabdus sp. LZHN29]|uniref:zinc ribbon domain-containing protein YjdM n=1 Tax=Aestuariirhabdus sp. LZHN29 TaxID=3417462 RepID=UPI003CEE56E4